MVACIREAIAVHRPDVDKHHRIQLSGPVPEFNVIYGTDSSSCARGDGGALGQRHAPDPGQEQDLLACRDAAPRLARATSTRCNLHPSQATRSRGGLGFYPACAPTPEALTSIALLPLPLELGVSRNYERLTWQDHSSKAAPGCQRHGRGTLWQLPSSKSASSHIYIFLNTRLDSHVAIMTMHGSSTMRHQ